MRPFRNPLLDLGCRARRDLRPERWRKCRSCGAEIAVVTGFDIKASTNRLVLVDPIEESNGWFVITERGAFIDDAYTILGGHRWRRHICPEGTRVSA